ATLNTSSQPASLEDNLKKKEERPLVATLSAGTNKTETLGSEVPRDLFDIKSFWENLGFGQKTTLFLLAFLICVFAFDSYVIFKKGHLRQNSHSLLHAFVLIILLLSLVKSSLGGIL